MFLFKDVINQLETAEASLIALVDKKEGVILPEKYNKVIGFLNTALSDLFTRFNLIKGECLIQTAEGRYSYELIKENAISQNPAGFIVDTPDDPFDHTVLEITGVSTMYNKPLLFNVIDSYDFGHLSQQQTYSAEECVRVFSSPSYGVLRTPVGLKNSLLKVNYKVGHKPYPLIDKADLDSFDTESLVIDLPYPFLMPIIFYICSRANNARGTERAGQNLVNEGANYYSKYLSECKTLMAAMSQSTETTTTADTFRSRGFV